MANKKQKGKLTYFLDHPQIKRHKSPGNGESPGFFNQLLSGKLRNTGNTGSESKGRQPASTSSPESTSASSSGSQNTNQTDWQKAFSKGFRGD